MKNLLELEDDVSLLDQARLNPKLNDLLYHYNLLAAKEGLRLISHSDNGKDLKDAIDEIDTRSLITILSAYHNVNKEYEIDKKMHYKYKMFNRIINLVVVVITLMAVGTFVLLFLDKNVPASETIEGIFNLFIEAFRLFVPEL